MRLIDADELLKNGIRNRISYGYNSDGWILVPIKDVRQSIKNAPTIDAVEVVRCKDCKWCVDKQEIYNCGYCECVDRDIIADRKEFEVVYLDDYCSYGERKEDKQ